MFPCKSSQRYESQRDTNFNAQKDKSWEESFRRNAPTKPSMIVPGLYLSNVKTAAAYFCGQAPLDFPHIKHVVTIISFKNFRSNGGDVPDFPSNTGAAKYMNQHKIEARDTSSADILQFFDEAVQFMRDGVLDSYSGQGSGGVLVHCYAGVSRSATLVAAYLLRYHVDLFLQPANEGKDEWDNLSRQRHVDLCLKYLRTMRAVANPNPGFQLQLNIWHNILEHCTYLEDGKPKIGLQTWIKYKEWVEQQAKETRGPKGMRPAGIGLFVSVPPVEDMIEAFRRVAGQAETYEAFRERIAGQQYTNTLRQTIVDKMEAPDTAIEQRGSKFSPFYTNKK